MSYDYGYDYGYDAVGSAVTTGLGAVFGFIIFMWIISIAISVFTIICNWKVYKKAGKQGWESIIPIYNTIVLLQITGQPMWYIALFFVPIGNIVVLFLIYIELAKKFGQSTGFGIGLTLLNPIFMAILAFNKKYVYQGNKPVNNMQPNYNQPINNMQPNYNQPINNMVANNNPMPINNEPLNNNQPTQSNICQACGAPVNAGDKFCMSCGKQL